MIVHADQQGNDLASDFHGDSRTPRQKDHMSKKRDSADASDRLLATPDAPSNGATATAKPPRKPRAKRPYRLEACVGVESGSAWQTVRDSPDFDDTAAAHKWATEHDLPKADYRVIRLMSEFSVDTVTETKTVLKVK
jgi:hypothetical protein